MIYIHRNSHYGKKERVKSVEKQTVPYPLSIESVDSHLFAVFLVTRRCKVFSSIHLIITKIFFKLWICLFVKGNSFDVKKTRTK